ncbi:orotidine-5'-phosphate decarboxylase [Clostridium bowmanii]|uniref:orotidine-5'-phosphate decarboxylase n=1 Tax=Clostridium bowmanii TaxID=132925 RepID=UPI001C0AA8E6|nr:orotidine-5'-phosphate decarboxylase [Clostridium bowmanii]MBU3191559.1 orotidine-5'-phosphate decarboxylase [Clostridium bowmanii]MCA1072400.1 orotidine-5'-phosphate decarboxylase [Clostridium bowmanii]
MIIDKLFKSVENNGHVCIGLDTAMEYLPANFRNKYEYEDYALYRFNQQIIDATFDVAACYKVQIAYYEALGLKGLKVYKDTLKYIRSKGGIVIADIKRGDIAKTAGMYAKAHFEGDFESDLITVNPYMGMDSIQPYLPYLKNKEKGLFSLVRTSNKGAEDIEYIENKENKKVYDVVGEKLLKIGSEFMGECGYSSLGGVVGCTHIDEGLKMRKNLEKMFFLIPGYGAQGGAAEDVAIYLKNGNGGVVNASRSILLAYKKVENGESHFEECARQEAIKMRDAIRKAAK